MYGNMFYLQTVFDPEVASTLLPVLRADNVEESVKYPLLNTWVKDGKELWPYVYNGAPEPREKGRLQLGRQLSRTKMVITVTMKN